MSFTYSSSFNSTIVAFSIRVSILFILFLPLTVFSQNESAFDAPKVFLDCQTQCYEQHIRSELSYLNFMLDRQNAEVYLLLTSLRTGSGGREWSLLVKGQQRFEGMFDTLVFYSLPDASDGSIQNLQVEKIQVALLPFILKTSLANSIRIDFQEDQLVDTKTIQKMEDPWDFWIFSLGGNLNYEGQESFSGLNTEARTSINRVTDQSKFSISFNYNYNRRRFSLEDEEDYISTTNRWNVWGMHVYSISNHWSVGSFGGISGNSVSNIDASFSIRPAVEYNVFPYSQATKRQFTFLYNVGPFYTDYIDTTIFNKTEEWLFRQSIDLTYRQIEEWGRLELNTEFENYLHDWSLLGLSFRPEIELNLFRGFSINLEGRISMVRNQLNIPRRKTSDEEVLLQLRQLRSNYLVSTKIGINYRFGSRMNNVVNTRFF
jgi:hypothetical protein